MIFKAACAQELTRHQEKIFNINNFVNDGFEKVCDVILADGWKYKNINQDLMFSSHRSWVYFIVCGKTVVKVGETGNPLGIEESYLYGDFELQPATNSKSRFGRLRKGDNTDAYIREALRTRLIAGERISLWAKKCSIVVVNESIGGNKKSVVTSKHKSIEQEYLKYFETFARRFPELNKIKK